MKVEGMNKPEVGGEEGAILCRDNAGQNEFGLEAETEAKRQMDLPTSIHPSIDRQTDR